MEEAEAPAEGSRTATVPCPEALPKSQQGTSPALGQLVQVFPKTSVKPKKQVSEALCLLCEDGSNGLTLLVGHPRRAVASLHPDLSHISSGLTFICPLRLCGKYLKRQLRNGPVVPPGVHIADCMNLPKGGPVNFHHAASGL